MNTEPTKTEKKPLYYVGVGASAGGLEALETFFDSMPGNSGLAFIVVQHLSPDYKSLMKELLSKHTDMNVERVEDGMRITTDTVYLIPPKKNMIMRNGHLFLTEQPRRNSLNLPIDLFLSSMAEDQKDKAIAVILSGTGSDGTRGVRAIKEEGGTVFVQDEATAKFNGMPRSALSTGLADFELPPSRMAEELLKFINHPLLGGKKEDTESIVDDAQDSFSQLMGELKKATSVDFSHYKPATVIRRIERRIGIVGVHTLEEYLSYLQLNPNEIRLLFKDLLIGVTKFFRDRDAFDSLRHNVIPDLFELAKKQKRSQIRAWIAGCSTGEEAYCVAMLIQDHMEAQGLKFEVKVFATDLDKDALEIASSGLYPESIVADVDIDFLGRFFEKRVGGYSVKPRIREMVVFARQDIIKDPPFTKIDLISCRNLLIYLQPVLQKRVLSIFNYALNPDAYLFLGASESLGDMAEHFTPVDAKSRIYRHIGQGTLPLKDELFSPLTRDRGTLPNMRQYTYMERRQIGAKQENQERYYQNIIKKLASTVLVVNENRELIQSYGEAKNFITLPEGTVSLDIISMMPRELALAVSSAIHRARKDKKTCRYEEIRVNAGDSIRTVDLQVDLLEDRPDYKRIFLITLDEPKKPVLRSEAQERPDECSDELLERRINDLEQELQFTRENLQATIEELQTSNEELQATNEELLAANEELQSTNEELQSVNEELNTVNSEYQAKNIELAQLNSDMRNLMESTEIGTIFLDGSLRIRRFTPAMNRALNILEQDIGRPIKDLDIQLFGDLLSDAVKVMHHASIVEREVTSRDNHYLLKILPFRNERRVVDGVVVTLVDITSLKRAELALEVQNELFYKVLETSPAAQIMVDRAGNFTFANKKAEEILDMGREELLTMRLDSMALGLTDLEGEPVINGQGLMQLVSSGKAVDSFVLRKKNKDGVTRVLNLSFNPTHSIDGEIDGAVFKIMEVAYSN